MSIKGIKNLSYLMWAMAAMACIASCSGKKETVGDTQPASAVVETEQEPVDTIAETPKPQKLWFPDAKAAIDYMKESGDWDKYQKGILPQMAEDELSYATKLLNNSHDGFIVVDKYRMKVVRFNRFGEEVATFGMACARNYGTKHEKPDNRTPEGFFSVRKVHDSTEWQFIDDDGVKSDKKGEFGPRFIRLNIPGWYSIGIHGTCAPWSIGGRRSHGCIRVTNENIMKLVEMVDSGMPVIVSPGKKDMAVNLEEGYEIPSVSTVPGQKAPRLSEAAKKQALANREKNKNKPDTISAAPVDTLPKEEVKNIEDIKEKVEIQPDTVPNSDGGQEGI